jgi:Tol biopolymer transport system component
MADRFTNWVIFFKIVSMCRFFTRRCTLIFVFIIIATIFSAVSSGCKENDVIPAPSLNRAVPHQGEWGIYELNLGTLEVNLIYSTPNEIYTSALRLNTEGDRFVFAQKTDGNNDDNLEIYTIETNGEGLTRLTNNSFFDLYPVWSADDTRIAFLSRRGGDLDIYVMDADGGNTSRLYDSGSNDADIDWADGNVVFTSQFAIWKINDDGTQPVQITNPPDRGQWGKANLPAGDYDPRLSRDGKKVVFERLEDTSQPNGGYNIFVINVDGTGETRLTDSSYAQGLASWSHSGNRLVYVVAAINGEGKYDIYMMNSDGTSNRSITPDYFPVNFLCYSPIFSKDDSRIFFIGQWWE